MPKKTSEKVLYAATSDGNDNVIAETIFVQGKQTIIKVDEQVEVEPYIRDLLVETRKAEKAANKKNEQMADHNYV